MSCDLSHGGCAAASDGGVDQVASPAKLRLEEAKESDCLAVAHESVPANEESKDHLTTLPNELLNIFERLPAQDFRRLRTQSRRSRDVIDENESALARTIIARHRLQLVADHQYLTCFNGLDISDVLARFVGYYGGDNLL